MSQWRAVAQRGIFLHVATQRRAIADGYAGILPAGASYVAIVFPSTFPSETATAVAFADLAALASFVREMRPRGIGIAVADDEDGAAIGAALDELSASGAVLH